MESVITTLPIAPKRAPAVGTFLGSFAARVIAERDSSTFLIPTNIVGSKGYTRDDANAFHVRADAIVGGKPRQWVDADMDWSAVFSDMLGVLHRKSDVVSTQAEVRVCPCGMTEYLASVTKYGRGAGSNTRCAVCGLDAELRERECLLIRVHAPEDTIKAEPQYCTTDLRTNFARWNGTWLLADRVRDTGLAVAFDGVVRQIDPDLCWMCMPWVLQAQGMRVGTLVSGVRTLRQTALAVMLSSWLGADVPEVVAVPYLSGLTTSAVDLPSSAVRVLLGMVAGAEAKDVALDERDVAMAVRVAKLVVDGAHIHEGVAPELRWFKKPRITSLVAAIRKRKTLTADEYATVALLA